MTTFLWLRELAGEARHDPSLVRCHIAHLSNIPTIVNTFVLVNFVLEYCDNGLLYSY
jgi:hypothetical protein